MEAQEEVEETNVARDDQELVVDDQLKEAMGELAGRVQDNAKVTDLFGVDDSFVDNVINKAYSLYKAGQFEQAQVLLDGACSLDPTRSYARLLCGDVYMRTGKLQKAREQFEKAFELDQEDLMVRAKLGEVLLRTGERERAAQLLQHVADEAEQEAPHAKRAQALLDSAMPLEAAGQ